MEQLYTANSNHWRFDSSCTLQRSYRSMTATIDFIYATYYFFKLTFVLSTKERKYSTVRL